MTVICPDGHLSATTDYCDQCGLQIVQPPVQPTEVLPVLEADTSPAGRAERCPVCGTEHAGHDQYCERCGHDFLCEQSSDAGGWEAIVRADRAQFARFASAGISFPSDYAERRFELDLPKLHIGRSRAGTGDAPPEIDLAGTVEDPCISRKHAILVRQTDGSYAVRDDKSTNGTTINDDPQPVDSDQGVVLGDGDLIRIGAWTTVTIRKRGDEFKNRAA